MRWSSLAPAGSDGCVLGEAVSEAVGEEVQVRVFSRFCIGK